MPSQFPFPTYNSQNQPDQSHMQDHQMTKTTCLLFFLVSSCLFLLSSLDRAAYSDSSSAGYYASFLSLFVAFLVVFLVVLAVRTTTVAWITVMVLLAFAGKRRRVLAKEGRKITSDVAMYLAQVVLKEKSLVAFVCATFVSLIGMAWLRI